MKSEMMIDQLFARITGGDRSGARELVDRAVKNGMTHENLASEVYWPLHELLEKLVASKQIANLAHHYATRILRMLVDQAQRGYTRRPLRGKTISMFCSDTAPDELTAQLVADLAEADGYTVRYGGCGVARDEILNEVSNAHPDMLLIFSTSATDAITVQHLVETIREIGACTEMKIAVGGSAFKRNSKLAREIGADMWAGSPRDMLDLLTEKKKFRATKPRPTADIQVTRKTRGSKRKAA